MQLNALILSHRVIGLLLLFCLAAPCALTLSWLRYQKYAVRKTVKKQIIAGIDASELVLLGFSKSEIHTTLRWEHAKEFEFKGMMFDIVNSTEQNDSVFYRCWPDYAESHLNRRLAEALSRIWDKNPEKEQKEQQLLDFYKLLFFEKPSTVFVVLLEYPRKLRIFYCHSLFSINHFCPPSPPPQMG